MTDDLVEGRPSGRLPGDEHGDGAERGSQNRRVRILHVDDDELNRALVRTALARSTEPLLHTARLIEAADLARARAVLAECRVDVVLLDMRLPDGSGLTLAAEITQAGQREPPILVALTGAVEPQQRGAALAAGCAAVLSKPYPVASLCDLLITQLRRRAAQPASSTEHRSDITSSRSGITSSSQCSSTSNSSSTSNN
jgi:CheY-like chemotaxis protein